MRSVALGMHSDARRPAKVRQMRHNLGDDMFVRTACKASSRAAIRLRPRGDQHPGTLSAFPDIARAIS
jgi:hypothetical protein